jgi:hypothetical protein
MPQPFVHCAELKLAAGADAAAPGGAVTIALCGSWDHEGGCRWPHQTAAELRDGRTSTRVVFVADREQEENVRSLIREALANGRCTGPDGLVSEWTLLTDHAGTLTAEEAELAERISASASGK